MRDRLFVILQYLLPRYALTALVYWLARVRQPAVKDFLIRRFVHHFDVDLEGVSEPVPEGFDTFNAFFIRELTPEARPVADGPTAIVSPVDGTVSAAGRIQGDTIFQAKGIDYRLEDLLEVDVLGLNARFQHQGGQACGNVRAREFLHREVDRHAQLRPARILPGAQLSEALPQYPLADRDDQSGTFGESDNLAGRVRSHDRVGPAQQRLDRAHRMRGGVDDGQVIQVECAALERRFELDLEILALQRA